MPKTLPDWDEHGLLASEEWCRDFAKRYVARRLRTGDLHDVVEELSAYIGSWMYLQQLLKRIDA